jgi:hypothetical protein
MRTRSNEFLEWIDLDESDLAAIARLSRRVTWAALLVLLNVAIGAAFVFFCRSTSARLAHLRALEVLVFFGVVGRMSSGAGRTIDRCTVPKYSLQKPDHPSPASAAGTGY